MTWTLDTLFHVILTDHLQNENGSTSRGHDDRHTWGHGAGPGEVFLCPPTPQPPLLDQAFSVGATLPQKGQKFVCP